MVIQDAKNPRVAKETVLMKQIVFTLAVVIYFSSNVYAAEIARDVQAGTGDYRNKNGGYFEFGVGLNLLANTEAIVMKNDFLLAGAYRYRRFFVEAISPGISLDDGTIGGLTLGVNIWRDERWAIDLLGANTTQRPASRISKIDYSNSDDPEKDRDVFERDSFYSGAGVRLTGYFGNTILQFRVVDDVYKNNGITSSARIGYSRQVKNWNYHGVVSAAHASRETGQYWYGVSAEEASSLLPQYDVSSPVISYSAELGATYPVRENVVFRSTARYTQFDDAVTDSPLQEGDFRLRWNSSLSYVF